MVNIADIPTFDECRAKAATQLRLAEGLGGEWALARAMTAIGWLKLAASEPTTWSDDNPFPTAGPTVDVRDVALDGLRESHPSHYVHGDDSKVDLDRP